MANASLTENISIAGVSFNRSKTFTADLAQGMNESVPAAQAGDLTTRTSDTAGTLTMDSASHGITNGARLDIYWSGGSCRGATVGTVAGTAVPFTGATGDVLPAQDEPITAMVPVEVEFNFTGNNAVIAAAQPNGNLGQCTFVWATSGDAEVAAQILDATNTESWNWNNASGATNPFAGSTIAKIFISHSVDTAAVFLKAGVLKD